MKNKELEKTLKRIIKKIYKMSKSTLDPKKKSVSYYDKYYQSCNEQLHKINKYCVKEIRKLLK